MKTNSLPILVLASMFASIPSAFALESRCGVLTEVDSPKSFTLKNELALPGAQTTQEMIPADDSIGDAFAAHAGHLVGVEGQTQSDDAGKFVVSSITKVDACAF